MLFTAAFVGVGTLAANGPIQMSPYKQSDNLLDRSSLGVMMERIGCAMFWAPGIAEGEMKSIYSAFWIVLFTAAFVVVWSWRAKPLTPEELAAIALNAADPQKRSSGAAQLSILPGEQSLPHLQRLAKESTHREVLVPVYNALALHVRHDHVPLLFAGLEHPDPYVREAAFYGTARTLGIPPETLDYRRDAPDNVRAAAVRRLRERWQGLQLKLEKNPE